MSLINRIVNHSLLSVNFFRELHSFGRIKITDVSFLWTRVKHKQVEIVFVLIDFFFDDDWELLVEVGVKLLKLGIFEHHLEPVVLISVQYLRIIVSSFVDMLWSIHINQLNHLIKNLLFIKFIVLSINGLFLKLIKFRLLIFTFIKLILVKIMFLWKEFSQVWINLLIHINNYSIISRYFWRWGSITNLVFIVL